MNNYLNKKKITIKRLILLLLSMLISSLFFSCILLFADSNGTDEHGKPLDVVLQEIREKQGRGPDEAIDPRAVSDKDLEELGEAVMSVMHPDPRQHEFMDNMMGGEGSRRLARMHRRIGYNYLAGKDYNGGMMGWGRGGRWRGNGMMGRRSLERNTDQGSRIDDRMM